MYASVLFLDLGAGYIDMSYFININCPSPYKN